MNEKSKYSPNCRSRVLPVLFLKLLTKQNLLKNKQKTNPKHKVLEFFFSSSLPIFSGNIYKGVKGPGSKGGRQKLSLYSIDLLIKYGQQPCEINLIMNCILIQKQTVTKSLSRVPRITQLVSVKVEI